MPNLDGLQATTRIRQFDQFTPIISMTSNTTENDCMTYLSNGMNDILAKPFSKQGLLDMIQRYCVQLMTDPSRNRISKPLSLAEIGFNSNHSYILPEGRIREVLDVDERANQDGGHSHSESNNNTITGNPHNSISTNHNNNGIMKSTTLESISSSSSQLGFNANASSHELMDDLLNFGSPLTAVPSNGDLLNAIDMERNFANYIGPMSSSLHKSKRDLNTETDSHLKRRKT